MKESNNSPKLIFEEKKAIKLFLWLFYIFFITYDIFWYFILPKYTYLWGYKNILVMGLGIWLYILILCLLPISIYLY